MVGWLQIHGSMAVPNCLLCGYAHGVGRQVLWGVGSVPVQASSGCDDRRCGRFGGAPHSCQHNGRASVSCSACGLGDIIVTRLVASDVLGNILLVVNSERVFPRPLSMVMAVDASCQCVCLGIGVRGVV